MLVLGWTLGWCMCTLSVTRQVRNFLLSPTTITFLRKGISLLIVLSMGTGGMFSPCDVMISSEGEKRRKMMMGWGVREKWVEEEEVGEEKYYTYTQKPMTESLLTIDFSSDEQESVLQWKRGVTLEMKHTQGACPQIAILRWCDILRAHVLTVYSKFTYAHYTIFTQNIIFSSQK